MRSSFLVFSVLGLSLLAIAKDLEPTQGEGSLRLPQELKHAEIEDKAGAQIPLDITMTDQDGRVVHLADYFVTQKPVILSLGYYGCPMLCSLVLNGMIDGLRDLSFKLGSDYQIISLSIDEREQPELAQKKRKAYLEALGAKPEQEKFWSFHVAKSDESKKLADAVGFNFYFDKRNDQFAHGAGFFVLSPTGVLSRTLFGIKFSPSDIKLALNEAADGKIGSFLERVILSCFHYNPDSHRYGVYILGVMRLGGILTVLLLGMFLLVYFRAERIRR